MSVAHNPVDVTPPDITKWRAGTGGPEFVHTFTASAPGPHIMILAATHGNEVCGAIAVDRLLNDAVRPKRGRLTLAFHNAAAYLRFDPKNPNATRFVDEDLNRVWSNERLDGPDKSVELERARAMRPIIDTVDVLLDLHSMDTYAAPLMLIHGLEKEKKMAKRVGYPRDVICGQGHVKGRRLIEYATFNDPKNDKTAVLVECGQHWEKKAADVAMDSCLYFLKALDAIDPAYISKNLVTKQPAPQRMLEVSGGRDANTDEFRWSRPFIGLEEFPKAGTVIAMDGETPVTTPHDRCVLIMPRRIPKKGERVLRFGREIV